MGSKKWLDIIVKQENCSLYTDNITHADYDLSVYLFGFKLICCLYQVDKKLIPTEFTTRSWDWLFGNSVVAAPAPWIHAFINTIIVSTIATGLMLLFGLMVGYALAKVDFKGKNC